MAGSETAGGSRRIWWLYRGAGNGSQRTADRQRLSKALVSEANMATTSAEYIQHHLQNLTYGKLPAGYERADGSVVNESTWTFAKSGVEAADMGFMAFHVDTLGWSIFLGLVFLGLFRFVATRATVDTPGGLQN